MSDRTAIVAVVFGLLMVSAVAGGLIALLGHVVTDGAIARESMLALAGLPVACAVFGAACATLERWR
jgi:hypothetical protein